MFDEWLKTALNIFDHFKTVNTSTAVGYYLVSRRLGEPFILKKVAAILQLKEGQLKRRLYKYLKDENTEIPQANPKLKGKILERIIAHYGVEDP